MDARERSALAHALGAATARVTRADGGTHVAVVDVVRSATAGFGPVAALSVGAVDRTARANYSLVATAARGMSRVAAPILADTADPAARPASADPATVAWLAALGGAYGDRLVLDGDLCALTVPMGLRDRGAPVDPRDPGPGTDPRPTVVLLVHGLGGHESQWGEGYQAAHRAGATPLTVRYTTGQPIADSGAELAGLLEDLRSGWPAGLSRLVLVGHSMGGLVIREALARGGAGQVPVTDVVTLGTPHAGAPLERGARRAIALASRSSLVAPIVALGDERSQGVKDLAFGAVAVPAAGPAWHVVAATVAPVAPGWVGDGLVPMASAVAMPHKLVASRVHITGADHLTLLDHPEVTELLRTVLAAG